MISRNIFVVSHYLFSLHMITKDSSSKMPALVVRAAFFIILTNPYELAHKAMVDEGRPWPPKDKMTELRRLVVNSGSLCFVRFQIRAP